MFHVEHYDRDPGSYPSAADSPHSLAESRGSKQENPGQAGQAAASMSTTRLEQHGLSVNTFAGPWESEHSKSRMHVQITTERGWAQLDMDQWINLVCFIRRLDEAGLSIATTPEV